jgi:hypothetical protein
MVITLENPDPHNQESRFAFKQDSIKNVDLYHRVFQGTTKHPLLRAYHQTNVYPTPVTAAVHNPFEILPNPVAASSFLEFTGYYQRSGHQPTPVNYLLMIKYLSERPAKDTHSFVRRLSLTGSLLQLRLAAAAQRSPSL